MPKTVKISIKVPAVATTLIWLKLFDSGIIAFKAGFGEIVDDDDDDVDDEDLKIIKRKIQIHLFNKSF